MGSDWDGKSRLGGWAEKVEASKKGMLKSDKIMILLRKMMVAGQGLNLRSSGYEN